MNRALPPVVLIHGWGGSFKGSWGDTGWGDALRAAGREVVEVDVPGHGAKRPQSHDPNDYGDLASGVEAQLPDGPLDVMGFSLGGKLSLELASRYPTRFRRVIVAGVGNNLFDEKQSSTVAEALEAGFPPELREKMPIISTYVDESPNDLLAIAAVNRRQPQNPQPDLGRLAAIQSDILIINGDSDPIAHPNDRLRAALPSAAYLSLPGVDHFTMHHQQSFKDAALAFLNG